LRGALIIEFINPIMIVVFITFIIGMFILNLKKKNHIFLGIILLICTLTEVIALVLKIQNRTQYIGLVYDISIFLFLSSWITILLNNFELFEKGKWVLLFFMLFAVFNFCYLQPHIFNFYTYVVGALIYISLFFWKSFSYLKSQNFSFFFSTTYILLMAPLALLFGLSFMFVFVDSSVTTVVVFRNTNLYDFVCNYINAIFYAMVIVYMFKEVQIKNE